MPHNPRQEEERDYISNLEYLTNRQLDFYLNNENKSTIAGLSIIVF